MLENDKAIRINVEKSIKKSNEFSLAKLSTGLTLLQTQLFSYALLYTPNDRKVTFTRSDFMDCFQISTYKTEYALRDVGVVSKVQFSLVDLESDKFTFDNIFSRFSYDKGVFTVIWTPEILPHIIDLQEKYVRTDLTLTSKFTSSYSWILYDVIKAYYNFHYKEYSHKALINLFNLESKPSYVKNFALVRRSILAIAIKEINEHTEYNVSYKEIKHGRQTIAVRFEWTKGEVELAITEGQANEIKQLVNYVINDNDDPMEKFVTNVHKDRIQESVAIVGEFFKINAHMETFLADLTYDSASDCITNLKNRITRLKGNLNYQPPRELINFLENRE